MIELAKKYHREILVGALAVLAALVWRTALAKPHGLVVHFFDVGQGDAIFLVLPDGNEVLIDGGPDASVLSSLSRVMSPWDRDIDLVISTHPDADHLAGLVDVLERYRVSTIVETGIRKETALSRAFEDAVAREGARVITADAAKRIRCGDRATLDLLWPQQSHRGEVMAKPNDEAVVVRFRFGDTSFLFPADIERWTEGRLLASGVPLGSDVLKVAHHGSKTSTSEEFLDAVRPTVAVISVGARNRYGHPSESVLERLRDRGIAVFRTDEDGEVVVSSDGATLSVRTER